MKYLCVLLLFMSLAASGQHKIELAFTIAEKDLMPEGMAYDPVERAFYISSIRKKKIVKILPNGKVSDFITPAADGIECVLGMKIDAQGQLWACSNTPERDTTQKISNVHVYDVRTRKLVKRFRLEDDKRHVLNDLYITAAGDVFITDTEAGKLWVVRTERKSLDEFTPAASLPFANGVTATQDEKYLLVSTGSGLGIAMVDIQTKSLSPLRNERFMLMGYDGLYRYKNSLVGVQNTFFPEGIQKLTLNSSGTRVERVEFLCDKDSRLDIPTTGVVVDNYFYFIANSQMSQMAGADNHIKNPETLSETFILKIKLD